MSPVQKLQYNRYKHPTPTVNKFLSQIAPSNHQIAPFQIRKWPRLDNATIFIFPYRAATVKPTPEELHFRVSRVADLVNAGGGDRPAGTPVDHSGAGPKDRRRRFSEEQADGERALPFPGGCPIV